MVHLNRIDPPIELTDSKKNQLTKEFLESNKPVWKKKFILVKLKELGHSKCCYCECSLGEECKYMEVEHYYYKDKYKYQVVDWDNLLPACGRCNKEKGTLDVEETPIVHPVQMNPKDHLVLKNYRFLSLTDIGKNTYRELSLNDTRRLCTKRLEIGQAIIDLLEDIFDALNGGPLNEMRLRTCTRKVNSLLLECQPDREYSAAAATSLWGERVKYFQIKEILSNHDKWRDDFDTFEAQIKKIHLCEKQYQYE